MPEDLDLSQEISRLLKNYHIDSRISCQCNSLEESMENLNEMKVLIFLFSQSSLDSYSIDNELTEAINKQVPILPFQVDDTSIVENLSLDFMLKKSQWVLGYPNRSKQFDNLIVSVCRFLGIDAIDPNPSDPFDQLILGIALIHGTNTFARNIKKAESWLKKSANEGNTIAMFELYKLYNNSEDDNFLTNYEKAREWLFKAADQGVVEAQYQLATYFENYDENILSLYARKDYYKGLPLRIQPDFRLAFHYYAQAAKQKHKKAIFRLGMLYIEGPVQIRDKNKAFELLSSSSEINDPKLWIALGNLYFERNKLNETIECYEKAGWQGAFELGSYYKDGFVKGIFDEDIFPRIEKIINDPKHDDDSRILELKGDFLKLKSKELDDEVIADIVSCYLKAAELYDSENYIYYNPQKAIDNLRKAFELGSEEALIELGLICFKHNNNLAIYYFTEGAKRNIPIMQYYLGICLYYGYGTIKDKKSGLSWLKKSDIPGLPYASFVLGEIYLEEEKNVSLAIDCFERASNQNLSDAEYLLSKLYSEGKYIAKNNELSKMFYNRAIRHDNSISEQ